MRHSHPAESHGFIGRVSHKKDWLWEKSAFFPEVYSPVVFGKETTCPVVPANRTRPVTCRVLWSQRALPQRDDLSCAQDRSQDRSPPVDDLSGQNTCSGPPKPRTRMYTLETRGPFLRSYSLENLKMPRKMLPDSARRRKRGNPRKGEGVRR